MRPALAFTLIAIVPVFGQLPTRGQEPGALPKVETVLADFIEATGGKALYEKFKSRTRSGTVELPGTAITGKVQIFQAAPKQLAIVTEIGPQKTIQASDGKTAWLVSPAVTRSMDGPEKDDFLRDAMFNNELHTRELYEKVECVGIEDVEGKPAYKLVLTSKSGKVEIQYYDKSSHLLVKETETTKGPMGEIQVDTLLADYKRVDGLLIASLITQKFPGGQLVIKLTDIKHDVEIPADTFKRPASLDDAEKKAD